MGSQGAYVQPEVRVFIARSALPDLDVRQGGIRASEMHATSQRMLLVSQRRYDADLCFWSCVLRDLFDVYAMNDLCVRMIRGAEPPSDDVRTHLSSLASSRHLTMLG